MQVECESHNKGSFLFFSTLIHVLGLINFTLAISLRMYFDMTNCEQDTFMKFAYSFKYGSLINASIQLIHNVIALIADITVYRSYTKDAPPGLLMIRAFIRSTIAFPFGFYVCTRFWLFQYLNLPLLGVECYPSWLKQVLFTFNPFLLLGDVISSRGEPPGSFAAFIIINGLCTAYFVWIHVVYHFTGVWPMAFLKDFTFLAKLIGYTFIMTTIFMYFLIGKHLHSVLWNEVYVAQIPVLRTLISAPPPFVFGNPTKESTAFRNILSGTASMFIDRPKKQKTDKTAT